MAKTQFLTILLNITCFLGGVVSVTDKELEDLVTFVHQQATTIEHLSRVVEQQSITNERQSITIQDLRNENRAMIAEMQRQDALIMKISAEKTDNVLSTAEDFAQNTTIEERVALLEIQVAVVEGEVTDLDQDVNFLFEEQIIQDERLFSLEQTSLGILGELDLIEDELEGLQATTVSLDFRVTVLEEVGGDDGNSSVSELEERVETLEGTAADHETRISAVESDINGLEETVADVETRLIATEENILGLQMTDVELDERVTALEENDGGTNQNDTIVFHAVLTSYSSIPEGSAVQFNEVILNQGEGYDSSTGIFTVPFGGTGFYYFSVYSLIADSESGVFDITINGNRLCTIRVEQDDTPTDAGQAACSAASYATEGDAVQVLYTGGTDITPLLLQSPFYANGFTGFRI